MKFSIYPDMPLTDKFGFILWRFFLLKIEIINSSLHPSIFPKLIIKMRTNTILRLLLYLATIVLSFQATATETIVIKGSDTLGAKIVPQLAEAFKADQARRGTNVVFEIAAEGSSTGIASVIDGTAEIGMSSRDLKKKDISKARSNNVEMGTIVVAKDTIAIVVNESNPLESISLEEIEQIFTGDIENWSAITLHTGKISSYTRNTSSGTYNTFQKIALSSRNYGSETQKMAGNEQIAAEVANNLNGIGYIGLAYVNVPGIKVLQVDGSRPIDSDYPIARPLYFLIDNNKSLRPLTRRFIDFSISSEGQEIVKRAHFLPIKKSGESQQEWKFSDAYLCLQPDESISLFLDSYVPVMPKPLSLF